MDARDAEALAPLLDQLGYPAGVEDIRARLAALNGDSQVLVAAGNLGLSGFVAVAITRDFIVGTCGVILGLVVADGSRSVGVGAELLAAAESWAFDRGAALVGVRSNVIRARAHRFYERNGYQRIKSQHIFEKRRP
ncbi:MAG TPA: GNAT family N-acetyltransferase [Candidatus Cybelea sp.]